MDFHREENSGLATCTMIHAKGSLIRYVYKIFRNTLNLLMRMRTYRNRGEFYPVKRYILLNIHQNSKGCCLRNVVWSAKFTSNIETVNAW